MHKTFGAEYRAICAIADSLANAMATVVTVVRDTPDITAQELLIKLADRHRYYVDLRADMSQTIRDAAQGEGEP